MDTFSDGAGSSAVEKQRVWEYFADVTKSPEACVDFHNPRGRLLNPPEASLAADEKVVDKSAAGDEPPGRYEKLGGGAILGRDMRLVEQPKVKDSSSTVTYERSGQIAIVVVTPPGTFLVNPTPLPNECKVLDDENRLAYYWYGPGEKISNDSSPNYRHTIRWDRLDSIGSSAAEVAYWAIRPKPEVVPGKTQKSGVTLRADVISELIKAYYPRVLTALDRDRAQAQIALSGLTALVGVALTAITISIDQDQRSGSASVSSALAIVLWLVTSVLFGFALNQRDKPFECQLDSESDPWARELLSHVEGQAARAYRWLNVALWAAVGAIAVTGLAAILLLRGPPDPAYEDVKVHLTPSGARLFQDCSATPLAGKVRRVDLSDDAVLIRDVDCRNGPTSFILDRDFITAVEVEH